MKFPKLPNFNLLAPTFSGMEEGGRGGICPCRHCRWQCKIFARGVNFTIFTHFLFFFLTKTVEIRWNWRCKIFNLKIRRCKILDKFHVCINIIIIITININSIITINIIIIITINIIIIITINIIIIITSSRSLTGEQGSSWSLPCSFLLSWKAIVDIVVILELEICPSFFALSSLLHKNLDWRQRCRESRRSTGGEKPFALVTLKIGCFRILISKYRIFLPFSFQPWRRVKSHLVPRGELRRRGWGGGARWPWSPRGGCQRWWSWRWQSWGGVWRERWSWWRGWRLMMTALVNRVAVQGFNVADMVLRKTIFVKRSCDEKD